MATAVTTDRLEAEVKKLGGATARYGNPDSHNRSADFIGVTNHITAGGLGSRTAREYIRDILVSEYLKANAAIAPDGTIWFIARGMASHDLYYSAEGKRLTEQGKWPLAGGSQNKRGSLSPWSPHSYGIEVITAAKMSTAQRRSLLILNAALCKIYGWPAGVAHGHGEIAYNRDFGDPNIDMSQFRNELAAMLNAKPSTPTQKWSPILMAELHEGFEETVVLKPGKSAGIKGTKKYFRVFTAPAAGKGTKKFDLTAAVGAKCAAGDGQLEVVFTTYSDKGKFVREGAPTTTVVRKGWTWAPAHVMGTAANGEYLVITVKNQGNSDITIYKNRTDGWMD